MKKQKIVFILPSLRAGGAERVLSFLSCALDAELFTPQLLIIGFKKDAKYTYPKTNTIFLNKKHTRHAVVDIIKFLIEHKPMIAMSSIGQLNILLGLLSIFLRKIKFVGRIASVDSVRVSFENKQPGWFSTTLTKIAYKNLDQIICQSEDMQNDLQSNMNIPLNRIALINNPITSYPEEIKHSNKNLREVHFITVGRLSKVKGHERIIRHLAKIKSYEFEYTIVGSGDLEEHLKLVVAELNLNKKVTFIPYSNLVYELLIQHDIFLQGSFVEGFPNAALESCVSGVPVLAYNVPGGTKEIIKTGENGFLANTPEEFERVLEDPTILTSLDPEKISRDTKENFSSEKILKQYETAFLELTK